MAICAAIARRTGGSIYSDYTGALMSDEACVAEARALLGDVRQITPPNLRKEWPEKLLSVLKEQHPDYRLNPSVRWPNTEVVREVGSVFYSQTSAFSGGALYHFFAVTACLSPIGFVPFHAGSRLGVGGLNDVPTSHHLRRGYEDVVRGFARKAEAERGSKYLAMLKSAAPTLIQCLNVVMQNPDVLGDEDRARRYSGKLVPHYPTAEAIAHPPREWRAMTSRELPEAIVVETRDGFAKCRDEWPSIAARLQNLL
jgi:hypothetical protein